MPRLTTTTADGTAHEYAIKSDPMTIGRSPECTVRLMDQSISRLHAVVERVDGKLQVTDQDSKTGTFVNDSKITCAEIKHGDQLRVGSVTLKVELEDVAPPPRPVSGRRTPAIPERAAARSDAPAEPAKPSSSTSDRTQRSSRRKLPSRKILGGVTLSKNAQTIVKIACALISLISLIGIIYILARPRQVVVKTHQRAVDPMEEPGRLKGEAYALWDKGREAERQNNVQEAYRLLCQAKEKVEKATGLLDDLAKAHQGAGWEWIDRMAAEVNMRAQAIRMDHFRVEMQVKRGGR